MKNLINRFLTFVTRDRRSPRVNREHVGQNLMITTVFIFFVFLINFAIIIATDKKFGVDLSKNAKDVYQTTVTKAAKRGSIYDRNGNVIAENSTTYTVYAIIDKKYVSASKEKLYVQDSQFDKLAEILNQQIGIDTDYAKKQLEQKDLTQVYFGSSGSKLSYSTMKAIQEAAEKEGIKGVDFDSSASRLYPNGTFASEFIGIAQSKNGKKGDATLVGTTGMEASMDDTLSGTDGKITYEKDENGNILFGTGKTVKNTVDGRDVYTTLDATLQNYLETQMDVFMKDVGSATDASATLVNAETGEILATTQRPTYNADTLQGMSKDEGYNWLNMLYGTNYEPGSTMKVMLLASAINEGAFNPNQSYYNGDGITIADTTINDWSVNNGTSTGQNMTLAQGFAYSSNVGMTILEQELGDSTWGSYLSKFRFGLPTRFGMANEESGSVSLDNEVTTAMSAFGQGVSVTETQMLRAFSSVANDGVMLEPRFISQVYDPDKNSSRVGSTEVVGNPVSSDAASQTRDYMVTVGTDSQYGTLYSSSTASPVIQVGDYSVAVKSGTAQYAKEDGGYEEGQNSYIYSVVAMVPSDDPKFVMYVTLKKPEHFSITYWSDVINPVLEQAMLMQDELSSTAVASQSSGETAYKMPDITGKSAGDAAVTLRQNLVHVVSLGTGSKVKKTSVKAGTNLSAGSQVLILTDKIKELPDMYGWTKENVQTFADWMGLKVTFKGSESGTVIKQNINSGTDLKDVKKLTITLGE
ncbi:penicillin-binding protein PBP2X [Streptococcus dentapri]|uniref:Penicillin-binding protein PBP2X n=1 Tax=Streptococcus dentapri TaxID=573564 RepID=A0ABV8D032_9STRE